MSALTVTASSAVDHVDITYQAGDSEPDVTVAQDSDNYQLRISYAATITLDHAAAVVAAKALLAEPAIYEAVYPAAQDKP